MGKGWWVGPPHHTTAHNTTTTIITTTTLPQEKQQRDQFGIVVFSLAQDWGDHPMDNFAIVCGRTTLGQSVTVTGTVGSLGVTYGWLAG